MDYEPKLVSSGVKGQVENKVVEVKEVEKPAKVKKSKKEDK